jgi:hypothetical protein
MVANSDNRGQEKTCLWHIIEDCMELGCPSLSVVENNEGVECYCGVQDEVADEFGKFKFQRCYLYWFNGGEELE